MHATESPHSAKGAPSRKTYFRNRHCQNLILQATSPDYLMIDHLMTDHTHTQESTPNCHENGTSPQRRLGLIGCPIGHSLSPALFREHFASRPDILEHWRYDLIERSTFDEAWKAFLQNYAAVNVTAPFKENAFRAADSHDYSALRCRASNLLVKTQNEGVKAYNTDFEAVMEILRQELQRTTTANTAEEALEKVGRNKVLVIGCGGAGKAATAAALEAGMQVSLCNRTGICGLPAPIRPAQVRHRL